MENSDEIKPRIGYGDRIPLVYPHGIDEAKDSAQSSWSSSTRQVTVKQKTKRRAGSVNMEHGSSPSEGQGTKKNK